MYRRKFDMLGSYPLNKLGMQSDNYSDVLCITINQSEIGTSSC